MVLGRFLTVPKPVSNKKILRWNLPEITCNSFARKDEKTKLESHRLTFNANLMENEWPFDGDELIDESEISSFTHSLMLMDY